MREAQGVSAGGFGGLGMPLRAVAALAAATFALALATDSALARFAYVVNEAADTVSPVDLAAEPPAAGTAIPVGDGPQNVAITPDGETALVTNRFADTVTPIDLTTTPPTAGAAITVGDVPVYVAMSPDGNTAYAVNNGSDNVTPIDLSTTPPTPGAVVPVGNAPLGIAIAPDGESAYVANDAAATVTPIDLTTTPPTPGSPIVSGANPQGIAITPNGETAYVVNQNSATVRPIDLTTSPPTPLVSITVPAAPLGIAIAPDGESAYVTHPLSDTVTPIDLTTTPATVGSAIAVGDFPVGIAVSPNGQTAYAVNRNADTVSPIDLTTTPPTAGAAFAVGDAPIGVVVAPNQPPLASFGVDPVTIGEPSEFDASSSSDPDGLITSYSWDFGDGDSATSPTPTVTNTYGAAGSYESLLTLTDDEGCSTAFVFTGQTAYCNGSSVATATQQALVAKATPDIVTSATPNASVGEPVSATATLTGGSDPKGQIVISAYGPDDPDCSRGTAFTAPVAVDGSIQYAAPSFSPQHAGTYRWVAAYAGDADNEAVASACGVAGATSVVTSSNGELPRPLGPATNPLDPGQFSTAIFDGVNLHIRLKCPNRFAPRCVGTAGAVTARDRCTVRRGRRQCVRGKRITKTTSATQGRNKWKLVSFRVKPKFRGAVAHMAKQPNKRLLHVRQSIHAKRFDGGRRQIVIQSYRVRTTG